MTELHRGRNRAIYKQCKSKQSLAAPKIPLKEKLSYGNTTIFFSSFCSGKMNLLITSSSSSRASWAWRTVTWSGSERTTHLRALYRSNKTSLRTLKSKETVFFFRFEFTDFQNVLYRQFTAPTIVFTLSYMPQHDTAPTVAVVSSAMVSITFSTSSPYFVLRTFSRCFYLGAN